MTELTSREKKHHEVSTCIFTLFRHLSSDTPITITYFAILTMAVQPFVFELFNMHDALDYI